MANVFLRKVYAGSDSGKEFRKDFIEYLQEVANSERFAQMAIHNKPYVIGASDMLQEIMQALKMVDW